MRSKGSSGSLRLFVLGLILVLWGFKAVSCRPTASPKLQVTPQHPQPGQSLTFHWGKPIPGYLWVVAYRGQTPFEKSVEILPLNGQREVSYTPPSDAFLLLVALEDTLKKEIRTGPNTAVILYQSDGRPMPHAYAVLGNTYYRTNSESLQVYLKREQASGSPGCIFRNAVWSLSIQTQKFMPDSIRTLLAKTYPPTDTLAPECLYMAYRTAYFVLHDSTLAERYLDALRQHPQPLARYYATRGELQTLVFAPTGNLRDRISAADMLWHTYQKDSVAQSIILNDDFFRWLLPYAWVPTERRANFYTYIRERRRAGDLQSNDLVVMRYAGLGWIGESDTSLLQFVLSQEKTLLDDPILFRKQFAVSNWDRLSDFYRLYDRAQGDYLKGMAQLWLTKDRPSEAYPFIRKFVQRKSSLFVLWQEDLQLYGQAALGSGHLDEAEQAFSLVAFFHGDTTVFGNLKEIWEQKGSPGTFEDYLASLQKQVEASFPTAPEFIGKNVKGQTIRLSNFSGKIVVLNFWATWCGPCQREIPELNTLVQKFIGNPNVVFLAITDEPANVVQRFLQKQPFAYHILVDGRAIRQAYKANAFPTHFIVSKDGRLVFKQVGYIPGTAERLKAQILKLLGKAETPS